MRRVYLFILSLILFIACGVGYMDHARQSGTTSNIGGNDSSSEPSVPWGYSNWSNRKKITADKSKVQSDLQDFPVLISISDPDLKTIAQPDGDDILFTESDGATQLSHEIESYTINGNNGILLAWVKTDLSSVEDTVIYMYFGNQTTGTMANKNLVWTNNYKTVYHMNESLGNTIYDSTSNNNHGTANTGVQLAASGSIGTGTYFTNVPWSYIDQTSVPLTKQAATYSIVAWVKTSIGGIIWRQGHNDGAFSNHGVDILNSYWYPSNPEYHGRIMMEENWFVSSASHIGNISIKDSNWHLVYGVRNGTTAYIYIDGELDNFGAFALNNDSSDPTYARIGNCVYWNNPPNYSYSINYFGYMDEFRISNTVTTPEWIKTEYNNQSSPSTFYSVGNLENK